MVEKIGDNKRRASKEERLTDEQLSRQNWSRYKYCRSAGHDKYIKVAKRNEEYYLGGGKQWTDADRRKMEADNRFIAEFNHILPVIQTAVGLQLHSRVDMDFQPRGEGADEETAEALTKVVNQVCDYIEYQRKESEMFFDGLIQQRGFLEFRVDFTHNIFGEITCNILDPLDVHIDPDAQEYDPSMWKDVIITRWLTEDEIEQRYGAKKMEQLRQRADAYFESDAYGERSHVGEDADGGTYYQDWVKEIEENQRDTRIYMVIDRQHRRFVVDEVVAYYTGEIKPIATMTEQQIAAALEMGQRTVLSHERIRWTVTAGGVALFDDWSPYRTMTVVPYFPVFRRGQTRGMVDNLKSPQDVENKAVSLEIEIATKVANAGWKVPHGSLTNMEPEDLQKWGSKNGLVMVYDAKIGEPTKIEQTDVPRGLSVIAEKAEMAMKTISGMNDPLQGQQDNAVSGRAIQSRQYMGQTQMGGHFDMLAFTRRLAARKILELVQGYYTEERVFRITEKESGDFVEDMSINAVQEDGSILNDVTIGKYDVVITNTPTHATFNESQFAQMITMLEKGVPIPPYRIVKSSSLADKHDIAKELQQLPQESDPVAEATAEDRMASAELRRAQAEKVAAETVNAGVDALYSSVQTAGTIAQNPMVAGLADQIARSAGYTDKDSPPVFPTPGGPQGEYPVGTPAPDNQLSGNGFDLPPNTNPTTPVPVPDPGSPAVGANEGIETQRIEDV